MKRAVTNPLLVLLFVGFLFLPHANAYWVWSPSEGKFVAPDSATNQKTADDLYNEAVKFREAGDKDKAIKLFQTLVRSHANSAYAPEAQYLIAILFEEKQDLRRAVKEYEKLVKDFPQSNHVDEVIEHLFKLANTFLTGQEKKFMGISISPSASKASEIFQFIVDSAPYGAYGDQAQFQLGLAYRKMGRLSDAVSAFQSLIENYPNSSLIDDAHYQLAETSYEYSKSGSRDQKVLTDAESNISQFLKKYSSSDLAERAKKIKNELDEKDAEKNYRIALYYDRQGYMDSATIYYEDIATRFPDTVYGKKAEEKLKKIKEPAAGVSKDKEAIQRRIAEVRSLLLALDKEEIKKGKSSQAQTKDVASVRKQLETELASLLLQEKAFKSEKKSELRDRYRALREREKNLREKFKTFQSRQKMLQENPSPELKEVFEKWHESLLKEKDELAQERKRLNAFGLELKEEKTRFGWRWPSFHFLRLPAPEKLVQFEEKEWDKLTREKEKCLEDRKADELKLEELSKRIDDIERREFDAVRGESWLSDKLPKKLKNRQEMLKIEKDQWQKAAGLFEEEREKYRNIYGDEALSKLGLEENVYLEGELIASGSQLKKRLADLSEQKNALSESWLSQKEKVDTMTKAFGEKDQPSALLKQSMKTMSTFPSTKQDQAAEARLLKKRMKYLEREIRKRLDQMQDWERDNAKRMDELNDIMHPKKTVSNVLTAENVATFPIVGPYKFMRAFLFGLPDRDQKLAKDVRQKVMEQTASDYQEKLNQMRELQEEVDLQSMLIQGRAAEVKEMEKTLNELRERSKKIPGFSHRSMVVERLSIDLEHSLTSARALLPEKNPEAVLFDRLDRETRALRDLENQLAVVDRKMVAIGTVVRKVEKRSVKPAKTDMTPEDVADQKTAEAKLIGLKTSQDQSEKTYRVNQKMLDQALFEWYHEAVQNGFVPEVNASEKAVVDERVRLYGEKNQAEAELNQVLINEKQITDREINFLNRKIETLEKRQKKYNNRSLVHDEALASAIEKSIAERDELMREMGSLGVSLEIV